MHAAISDDELGDLLTDPACPSAILHGSKGDAAIEVEAAVAFAHLRHPTALNIEGQIDRFVNSVRGKNDEALRLTDLGRDFVSRLLGRQRPSGAALYVIPGRVFAERGRRPKNASLPQSSM